MGSKDESSSSIFHDSSFSSSAAVAQPLLLHSSGAGGDHSTSLLLPPPPASVSSSYDEDPYPPISYLHGRRPVRDLPFSLLFLLLSLATYVLGLVAVARRNPGAPVASSYVFDPSSSSCVLPSSPRSSTSNLLLRLLSSSSPSSSFLRNLIWTLVVTFLLAGPIGLALLWLLRRYARQVVYTAVPFFVFVPASLNIYWFVFCALADGCRHAFPLLYRVLVLVFVFVLIAIVLWIIVANWHRVRLTALILQVASAAFAANLGLLVFLPALEIGLLVYFAPVIVFLVFSTWNGSVVPMKVAVAASREIYKCAWKQERWVPAYFALAIIIMAWSVATILEVKSYVISGTVAQWYFNKEGTKPSKSIRSSLRNAFGPSFGTVCFSGIVMGVVRVVRAVVDSAEEKHETPGFVNLILGCCADFLLSSFNFVNKFTINYAAITGEGYCSAAKMTYELLKRNLLSAVSVETVSTRVMVGIIFVLSTLYAAAVCAVLKAVTGALKADVYIVAALAWLLLMVVLSYFVHVLHNVVDTVYVCYAIDRDKGEVSKQEAHEVFVHLPIRRNYRPIINRAPPTA